MNLKDLKVGQTVVANENDEASELKNKVIKELHPAIVALDKLHNELNNMHKGAGKNYDKGLGALRKQLRDAMDLLRSYDLFPHIDEMFKHE